MHNSISKFGFYCIYRIYIYSRTQIYWTRIYRVPLFTRPSSPLSYLWFCIIPRFNLPWFTVQPDLLWTLIYCAPWFTVQPDLPCTLIYCAPWFTVRPDLLCTLINRVPRLTVYLDLLCYFLSSKKPGRSGFYCI